MDKSIVNVNYSRNAIVLFKKVTDLCLTVPEEDGPPCPPVIIEDKRMLIQNWGMFPGGDGGIEVYWSLAEDEQTVQFWDGEEHTWPLDCPPDYTFPLDEFDT